MYCIALIIDPKKLKSFRILGELWSFLGELSSQYFKHCLLSSKEELVVAAVLP